MVNMKLRDGDYTPSELCAQYGWDEAELCRRLAAEGYSYNEDKNAFVYAG